MDKRNKPDMFLKKYMKIKFFLEAGIQEIIKYYKLK